VIPDLLCEPSPHQVSLEEEIQQRLDLYAAHTLLDVASERYGHHKEGDA
jgi:hypothetical protein